MKTSATIAALSAVVAPVVAQGVGSIAIVNRCNFDLYLWTVEGNEAPSAMYTLPKGQPQIGYKETYRNTRGGPGVSIKIAPYYMAGGVQPASSLNITQFEYTLPLASDPSVYYDLSFVNGNSLRGIPYTYSPSDPGVVPQCVANQCAGDMHLCQLAGYTFSKDDENTHACPSSQDLVFTMCNTNEGLGPQGPTGEVTLADFDGMMCADATNPDSALVPCNPYAKVKRDAEADADSNAMAVCGSTGAMGEIVGLCDEPEPAPAPTTSSTSTTPSPTPTPSSSSAPAPSPVNALAVEKSSSAAPPPSSSSTPAAAASPAPIANSPAAVLTNTFTNVVTNLLLGSNDQALSQISSTGVECWQSIQGDQGCASFQSLLGRRSTPEKREPHAHAHAHSHNHMDFHRRNRIQKRH